MMKSNATTAATLDSVCDTMTSIKLENTDAALLHTDLRLMLENSATNISAVAFVSKARKVWNTLGEINAVTKALQESKPSLAQGHKFLNELSCQVHHARTTTGNSFCQCKLCLKMLALISDLTPDHPFESGVMNVQSGHWEDSTPEKMEVCSIC